MKFNFAGDYMDAFLRKCTVADLSVLCELSTKTYYETFAQLNTTENMKAYLEYAFNAEKLLDELKDVNSEFFFLFSDGELAGYIKLNEAPSQSDINDKDSLEIERIYVTAEFQSRGLGKYLLEQAIKATTLRDKKYIWLGVWEKNSKAIGFYKRNGFYEVGTHSFIMGDEEQTDYIMKKDL